MGEDHSGKLIITDSLAIDAGEVRFDFVRASGPGGQHVNKTATAVQLRFDVANSPSLPEAVRARLLRLAGRRITGEGELIIDARRYRSQERNRQDALERLVNLVRKAAAPPQPRRRTKPTKASVERRLAAKRRQSEKKRQRGRVPPDSD